MVLKAAISAAVVVAFACRAVPERGAEPLPRVEVNAHRAPQVTGELVETLAVALRAASCGEASLATFVRTYPDHAAALAATGSDQPPIDEVRRLVAADPGPALERVRATLDAPMTVEGWARALAEYRDLCAPSVGLHLLQARPASAPWPAALPWADADGFRLDLARQHVRRREAAMALEVLPVEPRGEAALLRARLLLLVGQEDEGLVALRNLLDAPDVGIRCAALATQASLAARSGDLEGARLAYERALETADWHGCDRARSDLGIVLAQLGLRDEALAELDAARLALLEDGDARGALRSLRAESAWHASQGESDEARELDRRARTLVRQAGLLPD